jgi:nitrogen regulatory protein P-II 1
MSGKRESDLIAEPCRFGESGNYDHILARTFGHTEVYRGQEYAVDLLPKVKVELVLPDNLVEPAVAAIIRTSATGKIGDGKIFLSNITDAIRIRNQERGAEAL